MVSGGVSAKCGDKDIPSYFTRLDHPEIASFIGTPESGSLYLATKSADSSANMKGASTKHKQNPHYLRQTKN